MRLIYRLVLFALLLFMFRTPVTRLLQTSRHFVKVVPSTIRDSSTTAADMSNSSRPSGLIAKQGLEVLTFGTPNGHKATIILEELKEAYGKDYVYQSINIMENIQKEKWFTDLGRFLLFPIDV